ncbi:MAG: EVE domain-containing protein [Oligoflexia bacterium]|nr:EVE domain-containing protein [Oligoflexia bacterium]
MNYWILKSEPETYSLLDLKSQRTTVWDGIRNYQARNNLRLMKTGDLAFFFHTGEEKRIVGVCKILGEAYPDPSTSEDWSVVKIGFGQMAPRPLTLSQIKADSKLKGLVLVKQGRLSVSPVAESEAKRLLELLGL